MEKKAQILIGILLIAAIIGYNYIYKDHRDIAAETAQFEIKTKDLYNEFANDPTLAEAKYLNKVVTLSGIVSEYNTTEITIDDNAFCQLLDSSELPISISKNITLKGRVIGYDDLLEQIKLDQCTIIKH